MGIGPLDPKIGQDLVSAMDMRPIEQALGGPENMPKLIPGELGRMRLVNALESQFGDGFRSNAVARKALDHFDAETQVIRETLQMRDELNG